MVWSKMQLLRVAGLKGKGRCDKRGQSVLLGKVRRADTLGVFFKRWASSSGGHN